MVKNKKIILTGGGTGGPVSPLLAVYDEMKVSDPDVEFVWIGTRTGLEREMVAKENIKYLKIASGKLRRYFSWQNFIDPINIFLGFLQSILILLEERPGLVMSAGGFVSVPVAFAAWVLRIPILIHQQDVRPGLANKLMAPIAQIVTVTFEKSLADYGEKAKWIGNPLRKTFKDNAKKSCDKNSFNLKNDLPVIFVVGGGGGSKAINDIVRESLSELTRGAEIIHSVGKCNDLNLIKYDNYHAYDFLDTEMMVEALCKADVVVTRCGLSILTELSYLEKPCILIPMPDTHQEDNAEIFMNNEAAIILNQKSLTREKFVEKVTCLLKDEELKKFISTNIKKVIKSGAEREMALIVKSILNA